MFSTRPFEFRRSRMKPASLVGRQEVGNLRNESDARRKGRLANGRDAGGGGGPATWPSAAPIGAGPFASERFIHSRTGVYGLVCGSAPVDTPSAADKLEKSKKIFNFERFELITHAPLLRRGHGRNEGSSENLMSLN